MLLNWKVPELTSNVRATQTRTNTPFTDLKPRLNPPVHQVHRWFPNLISAAF
jgi:hypothetical protein